MEENNDKETTGKSASLVNIKVSDIFGLSKSTAEIRKVSDNILKSLEKGIGKLSTPAVTIIQAKADAKAITIKGQADIEITQRKMDLCSTFINTIRDSGGSEELIELAHRSSSREILEGIERQGVREKVGHYLFEELPYISQTETSQTTIDNDWLTIFWDTVEKKSAEDIQKIYAKILAGECLNPGSFSSRLLHILSIMTQKDAKAFETVCSMSIQDIGGTYLLEPLEEFDNFLQIAITNIDGLGDYVIEDLESLGLLGRSSMVAFHEEEDGTEKNVGGVTCKVKVINKEALLENQHYVTGVPFTKPAEELRSILSLQGNQDYFSALRSFSLQHLGIELKPIL